MSANLLWVAAALLGLQAAALLYAIYLTEPHRGHCLYGVLESWECQYGVTADAGYRTPASPLL